MSSFGPSWCWIRQLSVENASLFVLHGCLYKKKNQPFEGSFVRQSPVKTYCNVLIMGCNAFREHLRFSREQCTSQD